MHLKGMQQSENSTASGSSIDYPMTTKYETQEKNLGEKEEEASKECHTKNGSHRTR